MSSKKNILVVGDSFTIGQGCSDSPADQPSPESLLPSQYCWPTLLANDLSNTANVINVARRGNSQSGIFVNVLEHCSKHSIGQKSIDMIIFAGTSIGRVQIPNYKDSNSVRNWVIMPRKEDEPDYILRAKEYYTKYLLNDAILETNAVTSLLAAYGFARANNIDFLWSTPRRGTVRFEQWLDPITDLEFNSMMRYDFSGVNDLAFNRTCIVSDSDTHPNDLGHQIYYNNVIKVQLLPKLGLLGY